MHKGERDRDTVGSRHPSSERGIEWRERDDEMKSMR